MFINISLVVTRCNKTAHNYIVSDIKMIIKAKNSPDENDVQIAAVRRRFSKLWLRRL